MPYESDAPAYAAFTFAQNVYGTLILLDDGYNLKPSVISQWKWDFQKNKYILKLDTKLKFHNGRKINAKDLEFSLLRSFLTTEKLFQSKWLKEIVGITSLSPEMKYKTGMIEGIKIISDSEIEIALNKPNPSFLYLFTRSQPSLVPIEEFDENYVNFRNLPVGVGPFKVLSVDKSNGIIKLERFAQLNEEINKFTARFCDIYVKGFPTEAQFDIVIGGYKEMADKIADKNIIYSFITPENASLVSAVNFSFYSELSNNIDFRKAIYFGLDKNLIINKNRSLFSQANEIIPANLGGQNPVKNPFNFEKAKKFADKIPDELMNKKFRLLVHGAGTELAPYAKEIEKQIHRLGFQNIKFEVTGVNDLDKDKHKDVVAFIYGLPIDFTDPSITFVRYLSDSISNFQVSPYSKELDKIYDEIYSSSDKSQQINLVRKMSHIVNENAVAVPLFFVTPNYAISKRIDSIGRQIYGSSIDVKNVKVKSE